MSNKNTILFCLILAGFSFTACEEEFIPGDGAIETEIVVEGFIESGENALPVYVLLTRTFPFFNEINLDKLNDLFVKGAVVTVTKDGTDEVQLTEVCLQDVPEELRDEVANLLGIVVTDSSELPNICAYVDLFSEVEAVEGSSYDLRIEVEGKVLTATTTIPEHVPLDSVWFTDPPGEPNDTLAEMNCRITDPADVANYYRYLTAVNSRALIPNLGSVTDDSFFDGQEFSFPLQKAEYLSDTLNEPDFNTFGLWERGDTATLKWCSVDRAHHDFWLTFEFNRNNQGPFSAYTRVDFNIEGGVGIWGGYSVSYYEKVVPLK